MGRRSISDPRLSALGKFQGRIERNANFRDQALNHNLGRNVRVLKVLMHLARMVENGCRLRGNVECVKATYQNFSSPRNRTVMGLPAGPGEAAHFLPGQIHIGGRNICELAPDYDTRSRLEFLFGEVEHLPVAFNQADTEAENKGEQCGLAAAFAAACAALIRQSDSIGGPGHTRRRLDAVPHPHSPAGRVFLWVSAGVPHPDAPAARLFNWSASFGDRSVNEFGGHGGFSVELLVVQAFEVWSRGAKEALKRAVAAKREKPGVPPLEGNRFDGYTAESVSRRSTSEPKLWNRDAALSILEYYQEDQEQYTSDWARTMYPRLLSDLY